MADVLATTKTTKPGTYIGRIFQPTPTGVGGVTRLPCLVGKGSRYYTQSNAAIRRSYINDQLLSFTAVAPYKATLTYPSNGDQTVAQLYISGGTVVPANKWLFSASVPGGSLDRVEILTEIYDPNSTYYINYQSTSRTVEDPLPFSDLRELRFIGDTQSQERYIENDNFFIPVDITVPDPDVRTNAGYGFTSVTTIGTTDSTLTISAIGAGSTYDHHYNRRYRIQVTSVGGGVVHCDVTAVQGSCGLNSAAPTPIHTALTTPVTITFTAAGTSSADIVDPANPTNTIHVTLTDTGSDPVDATNAFTFTALGPSLVEVDSALTNTNQFGTVGTITKSGTGTGTVTNSVLSEFVGVHNRNFILQCESIGAGPVAVLKWCGYGEATVTQGSISLTGSTLTSRTLEDGIYLDFGFGATNFVIGDRYTFTATAPMANITAKDSRDYTLLCGTPTAAHVPVTYSTNTPEGRFGSATVAGDLGELKLPGGVNLFLRNIGTLVTENRFVASDEWTFSTTDEEVVDWTLNTRLSETIATTECYTDVLGEVTGHVGYTYVLLTNTPSSVLYVQDTSTSALLPYSTVSGQPVIYFVTAPTHSIAIRYEYKGLEPDPGNFYYVTANTVRASTLYNVPVLSTTWDQAQSLLGPSSTMNDLLIAAQIALSDNNAPGIFTCQAFDSDGDGVVTPTDINTAINATAAESRLTDIVVLNSFNSLSTALANNVLCNDPFERKERALWAGVPVGTVIGDVITPGSLVYLAKNTLQVYGNNHAHGTRTLVGNPQATKTITLTDGSQVTVTLDGSFVATAYAALNASFNSPSDTLLRQNISGFDSMQTFSEVEEIQLIAANIIFCSNQGSTESPVYRIEESTTVDASSADNWEISVAINQKQYVTRDLRSSLDSSMIGVVPQSEQAGVAMIRGYIVGKLQSYIAAGIIAPFTNSSGTVRNIDPTTDVEVFRATGNPTLYHFKYWYNGAYPLKRLFGLYSVDTKLWTANA
jgi:hypothetical protein